MRNIFGSIFTVIAGLLVSPLTLSAASSTAREVRRDVVMTNFKILGSRDAQNEIRVSADIQVGSNSCLAANVDADIKGELVGRDLVLFPILKVTTEQVARVCPMVYAPVVKRVVSTIRVRSSLYDVAMVSNANELNSFLPLSLYVEEEKPSIASVAAAAAIMQNVSTSPINGGINPEYAGVKLTATFYLGSNSCFANGNNVILRKTNIDGVSYVYAQKIKTSQTSGGASQICPMHYQPVFETSSISVVLPASALEEMMVLNVERQGDVKNISEIN